MKFQPFEPAETINYNFVAGMYGLFTLLFGVLYVLHSITEAVEGFYIVFSPFLPCFLWSLVVRHNWIKKEAAIEKETKKD
ncbi:hypothetical protein THRCLA_22119 [Thraustotheca clavata]|uniref:Uncharacterized protein n=1 Tax=Thraustotheca clavata TaxID=74557 RepID=A0A1V9ZC34_9STRA|nr:hypothetical protein THRCLA_22119 [Thraustotheca clavata]